MDHKGLNYILIFLMFNYVEIAEYLIKATGHLYLAKSDFPETCRVQEACWGKGSMFQLALGTGLTGLPPSQGHPSVTPGDTPSCQNLLYTCPLLVNQPG